MAAPLQPGPLVHRQSKFARLDRSKLRKLPHALRASMRFYPCLRSRMALTRTLNE
jgi:hypothetical protein